MLIAVLCAWPHCLCSRTARRRTVTGGLCSAEALVIACRVGGSVSVVPVERALLTFCSDQMNLAALRDHDSIRGRPHPDPRAGAARTPAAGRFRP